MTFRHEPNDLELCDHFRLLYGNFSLIDLLNRNKEGDALITALAKIEDAARKAQWRLLEMKK